MRVSKDFKSWCERIAEEKKLITDKREEQLSGRRITELIPKHKDSLIMRDDILNYAWEKND